jgi:tRNA(Arg) A34 adenosine deaminase TadA
MNKEHHKYIKKAIYRASKAKEKGNHPFGAVLINSSGEIILESENTVISDNDITGHAELNLVKKAARLYDKEFLSTCTLYSSTEPCPMCAGSIFWSNIRKVVYGLSERKFYSLFDKNNGEILYLQCKDIFDKGNKKIQVIGPVLEDEAIKDHKGFW